MKYKELRVKYIYKTYILQFREENMIFSCQMVTSTLKW